MNLKYLAKNLLAAGIILCTATLIWLIFFSPKGDVTDPSTIISNIPLYFLTFLNSPLFLVAITIYVFYLIHDPLIFIILNPLLNKCPYCKPIRDDTPPYLVNGFCPSCNTHLCSKCFEYDTKSNKRFGCPNCSGMTFKYNKKLGYPKIIRKWVDIK